MTWSRNGIGKTDAFLWRYDSTLLSFVRWDGTGGGSPGASSTQVAVSSLAGTVTTQPQSTLWAGNAGFHFDGSGSLLTAGGAGGSSQVTISQFLDSSGGVVNPLDSVNAAIKVNVVAGSAAGSTTVNVSSLAGKVLVDQNSTVWQVQMAQYSTTVLISGNSTVFQGTNPWIVAGASTVAPLAGSTWNTRPIQSSAADLQMTATPAAGSTWNMRALQSSAADLQVTCTPVAGSTWTVRPIQSSRADLNVTAFNCDNLGNLIESSTTAASAANSTRRGLAVRQMIPDCTSAHGQTASSGDVTVISSAANTIYVYAYSLNYMGSTVAGQVTARFLSGSTTPIWRAALGFMGASTGALPFPGPDQLAVTPPGYLFKTAASAPLVLNVTSSGVVFSVAAFRE